MKSSEPKIGGVPKSDLALLTSIERKVLWLSCWMIDQANRREKVDGVKAGGQQASSASMFDYDGALLFRAATGGSRCG